MATNTGKGSRKGSVDDRTQVKNPKTGDYVKRNEDPKSGHAVHGRQKGRKTLQRGSPGAGQAPH